MDFSGVTQDEVAAQLTSEDFARIVMFAAQIAWREWVATMRVADGDPDSEATLLGIGRGLTTVMRAIAATYPDVITSHVGDAAFKVWAERVAGIGAER